MQLFSFTTSETLKPPLALPPLPATPSLLRSLLPVLVFRVAAKGSWQTGVNCFELIYQGGGGKNVKKRESEVKIIIKLRPKTEADFGLADLVNCFNLLPLPLPLHLPLASCK